MKFLSTAIICMGLFSLVFLFPVSGAAHVTPSVKLVPVKKVIARMLPGKNLFQKETRLTEEQLDRINSLTESDSDEDHYQIFINKNEYGQVSRAVIFITENTRHGGIVIACAIDSDGKIIEAQITDIQMELLDWVGPLLRGNYMKEFQGKGSTMSLSLPPKWKKDTSQLTQAFALIIAKSVKRSLIIFQETFKN